MQRGRTFDEYGRACRRSAAAAPWRRRRQGAVAALVRSAGTGAFRLPHTGGMRYDDATPKIPAAALSAEDADLLDRLLHAGRGAVRVHLLLTPRFDGDVESANVVGEVPGRERGGGDRAARRAPRLVGSRHRRHRRRSRLRHRARRRAHPRVAGPRPPRRTVRVVLFMNEEMGLSGARAYAKAHAASSPSTSPRSRSTRAMGGRSASASSAPAAWRSSEDRGAAGDARRRQGARRRRRRAPTSCRWAARCRSCRSIRT